MDTYSIVIAHGDAAERDHLAFIIRELGHTVQFVSATCRETLDECQRSRPDLIISGISFEDGDGIESLIELSKDEPVPGIIVTHKTELSKVERAMDDHVMAYLITPVTADDLRPSIHVVMRRFTQFQQLKEENIDLRETLATRKKVERAKGILMAKRGMTEEEAYIHLRDLATSSRAKMSYVAEVLIKTFSVSAGK
ncbi:MAG: ANTAR domain-containing protein [Verrucomicrobiales bacterium]|nr:ANTAR domain-containing protein [Verrucomicrobiales bacterium]